MRQPRHFRIRRFQPLVWPLKRARTGAEQGIRPCGLYGRMPVIEPGSGASGATGKIGMKTDGKEAQTKNCDDRESADFQFHGPIESEQTKSACSHGKQPAEF